MTAMFFMEYQEYQYGEADVTRVVLPRFTP